MHLARHGSVTSVLSCSSAPVMRPRLAVARIASVRAAGVGEAALLRAADLVECGAVVVGQRGHEGLELVVGEGGECTVEQRQGLQAVLELAHRAARLPRATLAGSDVGRARSMRLRSGMSLVYTEEELLLDHPGLTPHVVAGRCMHGGFRPDGTLPAAARARARAGARRVGGGARRARRRAARRRLVVARRRPAAHRRAVAGAAAPRARRDVLELAHHHRQDRGPRPPAGRHRVPGAGAAHRRRHLARWPSVTSARAC